MTKVNSRDIIDKAFTTTWTAPAYNIDIPRSTRADLEEATIKIDIHAVAAGAVTLDINSSWSPRPVMKPDGTQLDWGDLSVDDNISLVVDGTEFKITSSSNSNVMWNPTASKSKVRQATRTDAGDHDVYSITGTGITSYSEEDFWVITIDATNSNWVSMLDIDTVWEKYIYTPKGDNLNASVLEANNTYLIRYESIFDAFTIMQTGDVNLANSLWSNYLDLAWYDTTKNSGNILNSHLTSAYVAGNNNKYLFCGNASSSYLAVTDTDCKFIKNIVLPGGTQGIVALWNVLYCNGNDSPHELYEIDTSDINSITINAYNIPSENLDSITADNRYIYITANTSNAGQDDIFKFDTVSKAIVASANRLSLPCRWISVDSNYVYASDTQNDAVLKLDINTLAVVSSLAVTAPHYSNIDWTDLYVSSTSGTAVKIDLNTFTITSSLTYPGWTWVAIVGDNVLLWAGASIVRTNKNIFSSYTTTTLPYQTNFIYSYANNGWLYWTYDQWIYKLDDIYITNPDIWHFRLYFKTDGKLYRMDDTGSEQLIGTQT